MAKRLKRGKSFLNLLKKWDFCFFGFKTERLLNEGITRQLTLLWQKYWNVFKCRIKTKESILILAGTTVHQSVSTLRALIGGQSCQTCRIQLLAIQNHWFFNCKSWLAYPLKTTLIFKTGWSIRIPSTEKKKVSKRLIAQELIQLTVFNKQFASSATGQWISRLPLLS